MLRPHLSSDSPTLAGRAGPRKRGARVCIVTSTSISHNPRALKEADALTDAGYDVCVVGSQNLSWVAEFDAAAVREKAWSYEAVRWDSSSWRNHWVRQRTRLRKLLFQNVARFVQWS